MKHNNCIVEGMLKARRFNKVAGEFEDVEFPVDNITQFHQIIHKSYTKKNEFKKFWKSTNIWYKTLDGEIIGLSGFNDYVFQDLKKYFKRWCIPFIYTKDVVTEYKNRSERRAVGWTATHKQG